MPSIRFTTPLYAVKVRGTIDGESVTHLEHFRADDFEHALEQFFDDPTPFIRRRQSVDDGIQSITVTLISE